MHSIYELHCPCVMNDWLSTCMPVLLLLQLVCTVYHTTSYYWRREEGPSPKKKKKFTIHNGRESLCSRGNGCRRENKHYYKCVVCIRQVMRQRNCCTLKSNVLHALYCCCCCCGWWRNWEFSLIFSLTVHFLCGARVTSGSSF